MKIQTTPTSAVFRPKQACSYLGFGRTKLHEVHETDPTFPRKIRFSNRCVGWRKADLDKWLARKADEAEGDQTPCISASKSIA